MKERRKKERRMTAAVPLCSEPPSRKYNFACQ